MLFDKRYLAIQFILVNLTHYTVRFLSRIWPNLEKHLNNTKYTIRTIHHKKTVCNATWKLFLFVSLFGVFRPTREFFYSYGEVTITGKGLQILTYTRH